MVKSPELSDVTDRAKCSTEEKEEEEEEQGRTKQTALYGESG